MKKTGSSLRRNDSEAKELEKLEVRSHNPVDKEKRA
jgi:hypothetical protein